MCSYRLDLASDEYRHYLLKKKLSEAAEGDDKLLAIDALGVVMIKHGEEFGCRKRACKAREQREAHTRI